MLLSVLLFAAGCDNLGKIQFAHCEEEQVPIAASEKSVLGLSPIELIGEQPMIGNNIIRWQDDSLGCLTYSIQMAADTGKSVNVTYVPETGNPIRRELHDMAYGDYDVQCYDYATVDGTISLSTENGDFNEELPITVSYSQDESGVVTASFLVTTSQLNGDYEPYCGSLDCSNGEPNTEFEFLFYLFDGVIEAGALSFVRYSEDGDARTSWHQADFGTVLGTDPTGCMGSAS